MAHTCPINQEKINEPTVRIVATLIGLTLVVALIVNQPWLYLLVAIDFLIRGFGNKAFSYYRWLAIQIVSGFDLQEKLIPALPKKFAAKIGFIFSLLIFILSFTPLEIALYSISFILMICIILEAAFSYCVGCEFYAILQKLNLLDNQEIDGNTHRDIKRESNS